MKYKEYTPLRRFYAIIGFIECVSLTILLVVMIVWGLFDSNSLIATLTNLF